MKFSKLILLTSSLFLVAGCGETDKEGSDKTTTTSHNSGNHTNTDDKPVKTTVNAHTLSDSTSDAPFNVNSKGQEVDETTWDSFRYGSNSKFEYLYNFTYTADSLSGRTLEKFTKNGYYSETFAGKTYYERKSGNKFYNYAQVSDGYLRQEVTFDLKSKFIDRIKNEIYVHMYDFSNYEFDDYDGTYRYSSTAFAYEARFQNGYLTHLRASLNGGYNTFTLDQAYKTSISIPKSYYYK